MLRISLVAAARCSSVLDERFDDDRPLDRASVQEVERAAPRLRWLSAFELRYCSPSPRARGTGELLGLTPLAQPGLRDCEMGRWRGARLDQVMASEPQAVAAWLDNPVVTPHSGESLLAFIARVGEWLDTRPEDGSRIVAVADPGVVRAAAVYALNAPPPTYWRIDAQPLSLTTVTRRPEGWALEFPA
ncbi:histidine phosphatase family protein [Mangrovactinospora gilvigrisea]|uniref:Histidine phosphatase family protein n=1 Tax=Mangrovactinospora gilvigrisea TaxID=1428644 RepID=A0A1J7BCN3_9ACTN|nr:histidine phosphatase family protein [Mangrovactinospora gilvigrisea]OIV36349.1 histidine phosphatase family protein [Mangrovactinospora gilvigrisea]